MLDGVLDDEVWAQAAVIDDLVQVLPNTGEAPSLRTEVRLLTDKGRLYIGVRCEDDGSPASPNPDSVVVLNEVDHHGVALTLHIVQGELILLGTSLEAFRSPE